MTRLGRIAAVMIAGVLAVLLAVPALAHEVRPAYLSLRETAPNVFAVVWKVPAQGEMRLRLDARLPASCTNKSEPRRAIEEGAYFERWTVVCPAGLKGGKFGVDGLSSTMTDALVRIEYASGAKEIARLIPEAPEFAAAGAQSGSEVARTYFLLGVDHILSGLDHLLFVLALMLLVRERWMLFKTITAFTVAHSITLAGAALGYFSLPQPPVEAVIALSIVFVARELVMMKPGERRLSESFPWLVAFAFGLLHGFGFAGALKEIGLPQADVPLSLLTFNLGVEAGQLIFVAGLLLLLAAVNALLKPPLARARVAAAYAVGTAAMLWFLPRIVGLIA